MGGNTIGNSLTLTSWGESHGPAIGGVLDGVPPGIFLDMDHIQAQLDRRKPGRNTMVSPRTEEDKIQILSGIFEGKTLGTPLSFLIHNTNAAPRDYDSLKTVYRPGHADYSYAQKYGHVDHRGGGRASARETAVRVAAGAMAQQILTHVLGHSPDIVAAVIQLGPLKVTGKWDRQQINENPFFCPDPSVIGQWQTFMDELKTQGRSAGALIEIRINGIPAGLGEPVYDKLEADLAKALMSINAVKGVEFGDGFSCVDAPCGYDEMTAQDNKVEFLSNHAGGIVGGISTGQEIVCRMALKPTSSTLQPRKTITKDLQSTEITVPGRHDPCVGLRAVPIAEAMVALTLADHLLRWRAQVGVNLNPIERREPIYEKSHR